MTSSIQLHSTRSLVLILIVCALTGCDRDFGSPPEPVVEVVDPDLSVVQAEAEINLALRVDSPREVQRVTVDGRDLSFDGTTSTWMATIPLDKGLNRLHVQSFVGDDPPFESDLNAFRGEVSIEEPGTIILPGSYGGHSVTGLPGGQLMLMGGGRRTGGSGSVDILLLDSGGERFQFVVSFLLAPRIGHSLIALPDGRVLILGGGYIGNIQTFEDLVEVVELFDPDTETHSVVPVEGPPIRRQYHTASLRTVNDRLIIDLIGGRGDIQYTPEPEIGIRRDLRSFEFRNDSLFAIHTAIGPFLEPMAGHTMTALDPDRFLIAGMTFEEQLEPAAYTIDFGSPVGIDTSHSAPPEPGRIRHASAVIGDGLVALLGGRGEDPSNITNRIDIYSEEADRWFSVHTDALVNFPARYGHTATAIGLNRILVLGGFDADGNALSDPHILRFDVNK